VAVPWSGIGRMVSIILVQRHSEESLHWKGRHFYPKSNIAEFLIEAYDLTVGDKVLIQANHWFSEMVIERMQVDEKPDSEKAIKSDVITFKTDFRVRPSISCIK
jgi:hypothetical protein